MAKATVTGILLCSVFGLMSGIGMVNAQSTTSLFLLGFDPQPLSADVVGVADGKTTWAIQKGKPTGTEDPSDFPATAILVQGQNDVYFSYGIPDSTFTMVASCSISASVSAVCSVDGQGTDTVKYDPIPVQLGSTIAVSTTAPPAGSTTSKSTVSGAATGSKASSGTTGSSAALPSNTSTGSAPARYSFNALWLCSFALVFAGSQIV